jgi:hypothetical protein
VDHDPASFEAFQQLCESVTKLPQDVTSHGEFSTAMTTHAPRHLEGRRERVLLSISVSATGAIERVRAIKPTLPPGVQVIAVCEDEAGNSTAMVGAVTADPDVISAAEAIGRTLRFRPAERDGVPVAFPDYRMSIEFGGGTQD